MFESAVSGDFSAANVGNVYYSYEFKNQYIQSDETEYSTTNQICIHLLEHSEF